MSADGVMRAAPRIPIRTGAPLSDMDGMLAVEPGVTRRYRASLRRCGCQDPRKRMPAVCSGGRRSRRMCVQRGHDTRSRTRAGSASQPSATASDRSPGRGRGPPADCAQLECPARCRPGRQPHVRRGQTASAAIRPRSVVQIRWRARKAWNFVGRSNIIWPPGKRRAHSRITLSAC